MSRATIVETNLKFIGQMTELDPTDVTYLIIHHTGGLAGEDLSAAQIHQIHQNSNNWSGIGYHYVIRRDGAIERGRSCKYRGAHSSGYNWCSIGVHLCGNFELEEPTGAQLDSLALLLADLCDFYILEVEAIVGHRDLLATLCPGTALYTSLPQCRQKVYALLYGRDENEAEFF